MWERENNKKKLCQQFLLVKLDEINRKTWLHQFDRFYDFITLFVSFRILLHFCDKF